MDGLLTLDALAALLTLTAMEIVLGIDNLVFLAVVTARLEPGRQAIARRLGLILALALRVALLLAISWIMGLTAPLFTVSRWEVSGRSLILLGGGLFLIAKSTWEIYDKVEGLEHAAAAAAGRVSFAAALVQVVLLDLVFSLDSVITAVGMANEIPLMVAAMVLAMAVMLWAAAPVGRFVERHPSVTILALAFLVLIGVMLVAEGTGAHLDKGYVYFGMAFALLVEALNVRYRRRARPASAGGQP